VFGDKLHAGREIVKGWAWSTGLVVTAAVLYTLADGQRVGVNVGSGAGAWVAVLVGLGAWVAYLLDRLVDPPRKGAGVLWARRHRGVSWVACLLSVAAGVWVFLTKLPPRAEWAILVAGALAAGYALPCWGWRGRWRSLREVPYMKSVWVALAWALATGMAPVLAAGASWATATGLAIDRFLFTWVAAIAFDVRDLSRDRRDGIQTIPMRLGVMGTLLLCWGILAFFVWHVSQTTPLDGGQRLAMVLPALLQGVWLLGLNKKRTDAYYSVGVDGWVALQALALWVAINL